jgi:hypothetical protein
MNDRSLARRKSPSVGYVLVVLLLMWLCGAVSAAERSDGKAAAEQTDRGTVADSTEQPPSQEEGRRSPLKSLLQGATPEEQARLAEERKHLSEAGAATGSDPTAIIGYYQLGYAHNVLTNGVKLNIATAVIRLPLTPNLLLQMTLPYLWADLPPVGDHMNGLGDMTMRVGGRLYASEFAALFIGGDVSFPTAGERQLGTGKYTLGPGAALAVPLPRLRSMFYLLVQNFNSLGGDSGRPDVRFLQFQSGVNTILSERWWTLVTGTWATNWENHHKTSLNLVGQVGYQVNKHWGLFAGGGGGVVDKDAFLSLDWTVQAGVRWIFRTPLIPETLLRGPLGSSAPPR